MTKFFTACAAVIALGPAFVSLGWAQEPVIRIVQLDCNSDPELVVIRNLGDVAQDLTGLKLQSDQPEKETFDLFGILQPGESTAIELTLQSVFRDDDPSDYARIVDRTGAVVDQVNCRGAAPTPTVAPSPAPMPTPSPEALRVMDTPNGGGAPPSGGGVLSPALMMLIGGLTAAAGLGTLTFPWLRPSPSRLTKQSVKPALTVQAPLPWPRPRREAQRDDPERLRHLASGFALAAIAATAASVLLLWRRSG